MRKRKTKATDEPKRAPFVPCGLCLKGLVRINKNGHFLMTLCKCWLDYKAGRKHQPAGASVDFKSLCAGDGDSTAA